MSAKKQKATTIAVSDLPEGGIFRLPKEFNCDHMKVVSCVDAADANANTVVVKGRMTLVTVEAAKGPFKGQTATVLMNSVDEVELLKKPKGRFWSNWAGVFILVPLTAALVYNESILKFIGV